MEPAAMITAVLHESPPIDLPGNAHAAKQARAQARSQLTLLGWQGSIHVATDVLGRLVDNAVRHGMAERVKARLAITETQQLVIDVEDPTPQFLAFGAAVQGETGRGLWEAKRLGARVVWFLRNDAGKTVRATLAPGPVEP
ncbi:ATP-binding protein [Streptomyces agglomeratus]|uniref:ATP-binding protein n=1 Tax=Streptomyces agglomeratus TaxID=285458 RepID=UPI00099F9404|nr:ATP-binding protein [Streptomyces agglomeratus]